MSYMYLYTIITTGYYLKILSVDIPVHELHAHTLQYPITLLYIQYPIKLHVIMFKYLANSFYYLNFLLVSLLAYMYSMCIFRML